MLPYFTGAFYFFRSLAEESVFLLPVLLVLAWLGIWKSHRNISNEWKCFWTFALTALLWRCLIASKLQNISRYYQLPGVFLIAVAPAGYFAVARFVQRWRIGRLLGMGLAVAIAGAALGKALHPPKAKPYLAGVVNKLSEEADKGYLFACTDSVVRLENSLPGWQVVAGTKQGSADPAFWSGFLKFVQYSQGNGKALYLLLREPLTAPEHQFRDTCRREWGFEPFCEVWTHQERGFRFQLFRYRFVTGLFGLRGVTLNNPNPYGLHLPEKIQIDHSKDVEISFDNLLKLNPFPQWGGVEFRAPAGQCFDSCWRLSSQENCPDEFPVSVMLYLPNGWPVGFAQSIVSVKAGEVPDTSTVPALRIRRDENKMPPYWQPAPLPEPLAVPENNTAPELSGNVLWIGSRCNGTKWLTDKLTERNRNLKIWRLEKHPVLPHSQDPRYCFLDLAFSRHRQNPLLQSDGKPDWENYAKQEQLPPDTVIVLALGYEEVNFMGWREAIHVDAAMSALRRFLASTARAANPPKVLLIMPIAPNDTDEAWSSLSENPFLYCLRWHKKHCMKRLTDGIMAVQKEFPQVVIMPTPLIVPAGKDDRYRDYLFAIERYLEYIIKNNKNP